MAFGASADTIGYATGYLRIYTAGTIFVQIVMGLICSSLLRDLHRWE